MKVVVIGASGYVDSHVFTELVRHGYDLTGFVRDRASADQLVGCGAQPYVGDIGDLSALVNEAGKVDALFLASELSRYVTGQALFPDGGARASSGWFSWPDEGWRNGPPERAITA